MRSQTLPVGALIYPPLIERDENLFVLRRYIVARGGRCAATKTYHLARRGPITRSTGVDKRGVVVKELVKR